MPVVQHAVRATEEARAEHRVGPAVDDRPEQERQLGGVVFQVGVLHHHHVARRARDAGADGGTLATVVGMAHDVSDVSGPLQVVEHRARAVGGGVVDGDQLQLERDTAQPVHHLGVRGQQRDIVAVLCQMVGG